MNLPLCGMIILHHSHPSTRSLTLICGSINSKQKSRPMMRSSGAADQKWTNCEVFVKSLWTTYMSIYGSMVTSGTRETAKLAKNKLGTNCAVSNVKSDFLTENNVWPFILSLAPHPPLPGATSQVWNERKSAKSEIFRQTDFLTKWGEILHNMVRGGNNQILWLPGQGCRNGVRV